MGDLIWLIPALPLAAAIVNFFLGKRLLRQRSHWVATLAVAVSFVISVGVFYDQYVSHGTPMELKLYQWIDNGAFQVSIGFLVDPLTATMLVVVTSVGLLVHIYSTGYMHGDGGYYRFFSYLPLFVFSMLLLVMSTNFLQMYVFWEAVGMCSYLLIGFWYLRRSANDAAKKAFIVNRIGDVGFGLGVMLVFVLFGTLQFTDVFARAHEVATAHPDLLTWATFLLFMGAIGKSAQFPLHVWLPDAMEGPTPVSALIHAATMVTAGIYMVARVHPLFLETPLTLQIVAIVGVLSAFIGATIALVQTDIKRIVAYSTISQLGYMCFALGIGAWIPAIFHLATHAFFKGLLFLGCGSVIHGMHEEQDIRKMGGLRRFMPITALTFLIGSLANAGIPIFAGFFSKDEILASAFNAHAYWVYGAGLLTAFLTAFYMFRLYFVVFEGPPRFDASRVHPHESPWSMTVPLILLAIAATLAGLLLGWPPEQGFIHQYLAPVFAHGEGEAHAIDMGTVLTMSAVATVVALAGVALAWSMYRRSAPDPVAMGQRFRRPYQFLLNKWRFDDLYDGTAVQGTKDVAAGANLFDRHIIDGLVNGTAAAVAGFSRGLSRVQTGFVGNYALAIAFGMVLFVGIYLITAGVISPP
ncbi:MAG: NADH-quinone oxidoreductase subunit L [Chloroflexi bacterium]|nr:NADH-quinone oxidoreductase subunit L [Chloroflexota bacterium]